MIYKNEYTQEISFPIGGIGTGSFGISGNGSLIDWEIFNRPSKGSILDFSHIAVKAKMPDGTVAVKVLNGDTVKEFMGKFSKEMNMGYGYGPKVGTMCGLPHFKNWEFKGEFPIAELTFSDDDFPADIVLTVFNPFIPLDSFNSSIPAGFFNIEFKNRLDDKVEYTAVFSMTNPFDGSVNTEKTENGYKILYLGSKLDKEKTNYGDISIATDTEDTDVQEYWYRGGWFDNVDVFVNELRFDERLKPRKYEESKKNDVGSIAAYIDVDGKSCKSVRFVLSWNVPNYCNYWNKDSLGKTWKNYYTTVFESSQKSAVYCLDNFDSLYERTLKFKNTLFESSLDKEIIDAASSTLSVLKSPTVLRLEDGSFYGWEGLSEQDGSCEGTCQHVWNYAYALCFLFPELERSIRDNEFKYCTLENGKTVFRMCLPRDGEKTLARACLDGQMGTIIKTYREWKISGNTEWLKSVWDIVKNILAYAWSEENPDKWDLDKDGVLEGRQHHTLDMELFGASAWLQGMYMCALRAATEMAEYLGDYSAAAEYTELFEKGCKYTKDNLFNGEYFIQNLNLKDKSYAEKFDCVDSYWYDEKAELKYQIGDGCEIDQLLGQWHANICGLGDLFDKTQRKTALESLFKYNFKPSMRDVFNTWRVFCLNDEGGAVICTFPKGSPTIPLPYHVETMTGFEYALAGLMISEGMEEEGKTIVRAVRDRYDGKKRNPWNEIECGSNYARAMASFALLPIYSGFVFDLPKNRIGFKPMNDGDFNCIFSVGTAWGKLVRNSKTATICIEEGYLELERFFVGDKVSELYVDGKKINDFDCADGDVIFKKIRAERNVTVNFE